MNKKTGSFTLPGEAGYEELTLKLAKEWGADVIRDSDGTVLSDEITKAGYGIYSTICIIRDHNEWAKQHPDKLQQTFLMSDPVVAVPDDATAVDVQKGNSPVSGIGLDHACKLQIRPLAGYFTEQFRVNSSESALRYWQVFDRTADAEVERSKWSYDANSETVTINDAIPFHIYTVNFLAYQIWEQISMYNHVTNSWDKEHLMPIDPRTQECRDYMTQWFIDWCEAHPDTTVVRFTSMFYNFVWIWGEDARNRYRYSDWGSYDFTVSPEALDDFKEKYGYALTSEDFINKGKLHVTHMPPVKKQLDYMRFTNEFVVEYGRELVDIAHKYGKKAYVFYDDSWIGVEPYSDLFPKFGFDGLIKCVFSGYEARLCAGAKVETHELRLHPYLFPVGLGGLPTFSEGGDPALDAKKYWISVRRALLRQPVDRLGLGGYLHLTEGFQDFVDTITGIMDEFREIKELHADGGVYTLPIKIAVLHSWGSLRSWTLSGHFHETYMHTLIHINEALSGLPVDVKFISFDDLKGCGNEAGKTAGSAGVLDDVNIIINAGRAGSAWSGGDSWNDPELVAKLQKWVYEGGIVLGVDEPSAVPGAMDGFAMADVLGVGLDDGARVCHGRWAFDTDKELAAKIFGKSGTDFDSKVTSDKTVAESKSTAADRCVAAGFDLPCKKDIYLTDGKAHVIAEKNGIPTFAIHDFGRGKGVYMAGFEKNNANTRMLLNLLMYAAGIDLEQQNYITDDPDTECAYYPGSGRLVVINNSEIEKHTKVRTDKGVKEFYLRPFETQMIEF
ncbi:MAG: 1,3-beta-galactosyl-N-acetylhexosamine phosphorylase [Lachnospiraceae bacterium]|nr:1,3-beta-galactosyl-N-acetylhexosamine phosphorylase [Lachnospiraceae bacterium]